MESPKYKRGEVIIDRSGPATDLIMMYLTEAAHIADANGISMVAALVYKKTLTDDSATFLYCHDYVNTIAEDLAPESFVLFAEAFSRSDEVKSEEVVTNV